MRAIRNTADDGPQVCYLLRDLVTRSRKLFGNDSIGQGYFTKLDLTRDPILPGSRLPLFDEVNPLGPDDVGDPHTGNVLLFVREGDPAPCVSLPATKKTRLIDTYRFVCVYLSQSSRKLVQGQPNALDLVVWKSVAYPNYGQVNQITDATEKKNVVKDLYQRFNYSLLWDPGAPIGSAFHGIDSAGNVGATPTVLTNVPEDTASSGRGQLVNRGIAVARTDSTSRPRASIMTTDLAATWVPNGFEVKIVGTSGARKVWMRLSIEKQAKPGVVPAQMTTVIANTRDL